MKSLGANDKSISALSAAGTLADTDVLPIVNASATTKVTLNTLTSYFESRARQNNASVTGQSVTTADTYITNSNVSIPNGRLQAKSCYRCKIQINKTAGTGTPTLNVRIGTAGTTADSSKAAITLGGAGTSVADEAFIEVFLTFRTVGSGTTAVTQTTVTLVKNGATAAGFVLTNPGFVARATSSGFDSTVSNLIIGCSFNGSTAFAGTINQVQAELYNLA